MPPMVRQIEAIFEKGVLRPVDPLSLRENQRVRIWIDTRDSGAPHDREQALFELIEGLKRSKLQLEGTLPTREDLHDLA